MLHILKVDDGLILDDLHLKGVSAYKLEQNQNADFACLTLVMDVSILRDERHSKFNPLFDEGRNSTDGNRQ